MKELKSMALALVLVVTAITWVQKAHAEDGCAPLSATAKEAAQARDRGIKEADLDAALVKVTMEGDRNFRTMAMSEELVYWTYHRWSALTPVDLQRQVYMECERDSF